MPDFSDNNGDNRPSRRPPQRNSRKIAYSAVATALALAMIVLSAYVPVITVAPLLMAMLAWNIVFDKCGVGYGIATMLATVGLGFLCVLGAGFAIMIIVGIVFVPFTLITFFMRRITYSTPLHAVIRIAVMIAFASIAFLSLYFASEAIIGYIDFAHLISVITGGNFAAGYAVLNLIAVAAVIAVDFLYLYLIANIASKIK